VSRVAYLIVTLLLAVTGTTAAVVGGRQAVPLAVGVFVAWIVQAASFWVLAGGLAAGRGVMAPWIGGIAARLGVGVVLWTVALLARVPTRELMVGYGLALVAFLLLEAVWLAVATADSRDRRP
jgi:hypothetical protein